MKKIILFAAVVLMAISFIGTMSLVLHAQITLDMKGYVPEYDGAIIVLALMFILSWFPIQSHLDEK